MVLKGVGTIKKCKFKVCAQIAASVLFIAIVLLCMNIASGTDELLWAVGAGSLTSSSFIVFTSPTSVSARSSRIVGGYTIAVVVGLTVHFILMSIFHELSSHVDMIDPRFFWVTASVSIAITTILMVLFDCQHPPAAGVALVLVLDIHDFNILYVILFAVLTLSLIKLAFKDKLIDLVR